MTYSRHAALLKGFQTSHVLTLVYTFKVLMHPILEYCFLFGFHGSSLDIKCIEGVQHFFFSRECAVLLECRLAVVQLVPWNIDML